MRKRIPKEIREQVYAKYGGHCAYCGSMIEYKDMQVDHLVSVFSALYDKREVDNSLSNLMPACRQCNHYKDTMNLEQFRKAIKETLSRTCINTYQARLAMKYGIIEHKAWDGLFYFEKL